MTTNPARFHPIRHAPITLDPTEHVAGGEHSTSMSSALLGLAESDHQPALPAAAINDLVISTVNEKSGIAMLMINRPPANTLSLEM